MKSMRKMGLATIAGALVTMASSIAIADSSQPNSGETAGNLVHRVSHALATTQQYSAGETGSGYKWGNSADTGASQAWSDLAAPTSGNKWGQNTTRPENTSQPAYSQTGNRWGRGNFAEQSGNRWGRGNFAEQSGNRWGRGNFAEQSGNRWGRGNFAEQSGNRWGRG